VNEMNAVSRTRETNICIKILLETPKEMCYLVIWKHDITINCKGIGCQCCRLDSFYSKPVTS
jgi:hypothetical protein